MKTLICLILWASLGFCQEPLPLGTITLEGKNGLSIPTLVIKVANGKATYITGKEKFLVTPLENFTAATAQRLKKIGESPVGFRDLQLGMTLGEVKHLQEQGKIYMHRLGSTEQCYEVTYWPKVLAEGASGTVEMKKMLIFFTSGFLVGIRLEFEYGRVASDLLVKGITAKFGPQVKDKDTSSELLWEPNENQQIEVIKDHADRYNGLVIYTYKMFSMTLNPGKDDGPVTEFKAKL